MRALVHQGQGNVSVDEVADAKIERPTHALIKITTANNRDIRPGVEKDVGDSDEWPVIRDNVLAAGILP